MTTVTIPLDRNPDLAALVADKEPGDWIELRASIKAKDDQTLEIRLEQCDDCEKPKTENAEDGESDDDDDEPAATAAAPEEKPSKALAQKLAGGGSGMSF